MVRFDPIAPFKAFAFYSLHRAGSLGTSRPNCAVKKLRQTGSPCSEAQKPGDPELFLGAPWARSMVSASIWPRFAIALNREYKRLNREYKRGDSPEEVGR